jgi:DNA-binding CsgD family transcriptional regulator
VDDARRAVEVIDLMTLVAEALKADRPAGGVICTSLARATGADLAAWVSVRDGEGPEVLWAHPSAIEADSLIANALAAAATSNPQLTHWKAGRVGEIALLAPEELPGTGPSGAHRILALAKRKGFDEGELALLHDTVPALTMMLSQVIAASERQRRAAAQLSAAKELGLSERELEVLQLLAQGLLATSIASRLGLSPRTVHKHLGNIYEKMGVHDRLVAVQLARRNGLVSSAS